MGALPRLLALELEVPRSGLSRLEVRIEAISLSAVPKDQRKIKERVAMRNALACGLALGGAVLFGQSAAAQLLEKKALSLEAARKMVAAAEAEAERNHWHGVVAVVDDGGWVILLERMDHAALTAGVELAPGKARAAALYKKPSQALEDAINHGRYAAITARGFIEMEGALPVVVDGEVIGGIGASFATPEEDEQVAKAGLAALRD
jgi:glc operon protein GlcG